MVSQTPLLGAMFLEHIFLPFVCRFAQGPYCATLAVVFYIILQTIKNVQEPGRFPWIVMRQRVREPGRSLHRLPYFYQRPPTSTPPANIKQIAMVDGKYHPLKALPLTILDVSEHQSCWLSTVQCIFQWPKP